MNWVRKLLTKKPKQPSPLLKELKEQTRVMQQALENEIKIAANSYQMSVEDFKTWMNIK
jgi:hypothetical protein